MPLFGSSSSAAAGSASERNVGEGGARGGQDAQGGRGVSVQDAIAARAKTVISRKLVEAVKDLQFDMGSDTHETVDPANPAATRFLQALEAMLVHGSKAGERFMDRLLRQSGAGGVVSGIAANDRRWSSSTSRKMRLPTSHFWLYALNHTHKDTLKRIDDLSQVTSDVGRCRVWLRLALNEGLLGSYLKLMQRDRESARRHYHRWAFLRDAEALEVAARYVLGAEIYRFRFPLNVALLNQWQTQPLIMAGLWVPDNPTVDSSVPTEAVDALAELEAATEAEEKEKARKAELRPLMDQSGGMGGSSFFGGCLLNEDEALRIILQSSNAASSSNSPSDSRVTSAYGSPSADSVSLVQRIRERRRKELERLGNEPSEVLSSGDGSSKIIPAKQTVPEEPSCDDLSREMNDNEPSQRLTSKLSNATTEVKGAATTFVEPDGDHLAAEDGKSLANESMGMNTSISSTFSIYKREESETSALDIDKADSCSAQLSHVDFGGGTLNEVENSDKMEEEEEEEEEEADSGLCDDKRSSGSEEPPKAPKSAAETMADAIEEESRLKTKTSSTQPDMSDTGGILSLAAKRAMVGKVEVTRPRLPGFMENFKPFTGKFFDTPPPPPSKRLAKRPSFSSSPPTPVPEGVVGTPWLTPNASVGSLNVEDTRKMMSVFDKVMSELGLDLQNYECADCSRAIGAIFGPAKLCAYTKLYYCEECHRDETAVIPVRLVLNWDGRPAIVSRKAKVFLDAVADEPVVNATAFPQGLATFAPELAEALALRRRLHYLWAYLRTCRRSSGREATASVESILATPPASLRMAEEPDRFSLSELVATRRGKLVPVLRKAFAAGESHILGTPTDPAALSILARARISGVACILCSGRGFICEVCGDSNPIYPFHMEKIAQCTTCFNVYHLECSQSLTHCPRCERREARELNWQVSEAKIRRDAKRGAGDSAHQPSLNDEYV